MCETQETKFPWEIYEEKNVCVDSPFFLVADPSWFLPDRSLSALLYLNYTYNIHLLLQDG